MPKFKQSQRPLSSPITQTDFGYTGQRNLANLGLMDYKARFYDASIGRFIQPDSIIPGAGNSQAFNRYSYVSNNPIRFTDPSGHSGECNPMADPGRCMTSPPPSGGGSSCNPVTDLNHCITPTAPSGGGGGIGGGASGGSGNGGSGGGPDCQALPGLPQCNQNNGGNTPSNTNHPDQTAATSPNWEASSPAPWTIYQTPGYDFIGGFNIYTTPMLIVNEGSDLTYNMSTGGYNYNLPVNNNTNLRFGLDKGGLVYGERTAWAYEFAGVKLFSGINQPVSQILTPWNAKVTFDMGFKTSRFAVNFRTTVQYSNRSDTTLPPLFGGLALGIMAPGALPVAGYAGCKWAQACP